MKQLLSQINTLDDVFTSPVESSNIAQAEQKLNIKFSEEYKDYLKTFGVIFYESTELYGLGIDEKFDLNILSSIPELREQQDYPASAVPLVDIGDGHYYLYDNDKRKVVKFALPNGGVYAEENKSLEEFLISILI